MPTNKVIQEASSKSFCQRVAFLALRMAHKANSDDPAQRAYARHVFTGQEKAVLLALHVAAASETVSNELDQGGADSVTDASIEEALQEIWASRSESHGGGDDPIQQMTKILNQVTKQAETAQAAVQEVQSVNAERAKAK